MWQNARTVADGLRVPKAIGDFLVLRAIRESGGTAVAVADADMVSGMREMGRRGHQRRTGRWRGSTCVEGAPADGRIKPTDTVVVFNTGGALKYLDVLG